MEGVMEAFLGIIGYYLILGSLWCLAIAVVLLFSIPLTEALIAVVMFPYFVYRLARILVSGFAGSSRPDI